MPIYLVVLNKALAYSTILMQLVILLLVVNLLFFRNSRNKILIFFKNNTFIFGFIVGLGAVVVSLFYSEVIGYAPCELCWIERIFLYPQFVLYGLGLYKKDKSIVDYSLVFAILGFITSIYHVYIENGGSSSLGCSAIKPTNVNQISCAIKYVDEFGYITIPVMALTLSIFIIVLLLNYKYKSKDIIE